MDDTQGNTQDEYSYLDIHKNKVITLDEEEKEEVEEKPKEEEVEEIDPKDLVDQAAQEAANKVIEAQKEEARLAQEEADRKAKQEEEENRNPAQEYLDKVKAEGKEPTWEDAFKTIEERATQKAIETLEKRQAEQKASEEARIAESQRIEQEQVKKFNDTIDLQLDELYSDGKLTKIKDANNPSDQGVVERKALFTAMQETNNKRISEGKPPVYSIKEIYAFHYTKPNARPAGEDAPVSMGKGASAPDNSEEVDYRELKKPWSFFKR